MKIYVQDLGWAGSIFVIANSEEEARNKMAAKTEYYTASINVESYEINGDFFYENYGDR